MDNVFLPVFSILAVNTNDGIGMLGKIPWRCKLDMQLFKRLTKNSIMVMGRKTLESLPKALDSENRRSVCLTKKTGEELSALREKYPTVMFTDKEDLTYIEEEAKLFFKEEFCSKNYFAVIGGAEIVNLLWEDISAIFLSEINDTSLCDAYFDIKMKIYSRVIAIATPMFVSETNYNKLTVYGKEGILTSRFRNTPNNSMVFNLIKDAKDVLDNHEPGEKP